MNGEVWTVVKDANDGRERKLLVSEFARGCRNNEYCQDLVMSLRRALEPIVWMIDRD